MGKSAVFAGFHFKQLKELITDEIKKESIKEIMKEINKEKLN